jgi:peptide/nickel transport system ATP-binding protein
MAEAAAMSATKQPALEVEGLQTYFYTRDGIVRAVEDLSFHVDRGETLAIVGESGCGKSMTALSIMRLIPDPPGRIVGGRISLDGQDLMQLSEAQMREVRGNDISMIFQEPMTSLNPVMRIGKQISEALILHQGMSKQQALERSVEMLKLVKIPEPERRVKEFPHQLSGGMRQRVMIAMALACNPKVLIADEPTTALDVTIQAQILDLIVKLQEDLETGVILITHDLGVVAETADRVIVMYAGRKVEETDVTTLFENPRHPYTRGLLASVPRLAIVAGEEEAEERLEEIPGIVPALHSLPEGCAFAPRCPAATEACRQARPEFEEKRPGHWAACFRSDELYGANDG